MPIPLAEIRVTGLLGGDRAELPPFLGPTLRGALGFVLRDLDPAGYDLLFEGRQPGRSLPFEPPQPMLLRLPDHWQPPDDTAPGAAGTLSFGVRLLGPATAHWQLVARALAEAGRRGLGKARLPWALRSVEDAFTDHRLREPDPVDALSVHRPTPPAAQTLTNAMRWDFLTPVRIRNNGRIRAAPGGLELLLAARRRLELLHRAWGDPASAPLPWQTPRRFEEDEFTTHVADTATVQLPRFSHRKRRGMALYGTTGSLVIHGPWHEAPWITLGNLYHVGKSVSFGFGRLRCQSTPATKRLSANRTTPGS